MMKEHFMRIFLHSTAGKGNGRKYGCNGLTKNDTLVIIQLEILARELLQHFDMCRMNL